MKNENFAHLHVHTEHSLLDGFGSAKQYVKKAKELGFVALGCTDHGSIDGLIKFQKECDKNGITPVMGCEAYIVPDLATCTKGEKRGHVTLLIKNQQGYINLCKMLTIANLKGFYYRPRIDFNLLYDNCEGLIILTGCAASFLTLSGGEDELLDLNDKITGDIYLELMPHKMVEQADINDLCLSFHDKYKIPIVATNDCHYIEEEDWKAQEVLLAIQTKALWADKDRYRFSINGLYLRSTIEMDEAFIDQAEVAPANNRKPMAEVVWLEAMANTMEIVRKCGDFRIKKQDIYLPIVPGYENVDPETFLWDICIKAIKSVLALPSKEDLYMEHLKYEWEIIKGKKFLPYFMVVYELVQWCKKNDIMIGPGRGSVGGCLIAYLLGITMVDPIKYDLLFSRFITEDRIDYPDIDIDFQDDKRHLIREHLEQLYGKNNITSISTFLTMKGRGAIRDVARVFDIPLSEVDAFAKKIDDAAQAGKDENIILDAVENTDEGKAFDRKYPKIVDIAIKLEGQIRGRGQHAAAVVISADDLTQGTRGNLVTQSNNIISNWDMEDSEFVGLMKLDVLGLNTLSILNETKRLIGQNKEKLFLYHPGSDCHFVGNEIDLGIVENDINEVDFDFGKIPLDDPEVYEEISAGHNVGVFQLSAYLTSKLATQIKPDNIDLLGDVIALVRPGPADSGMTDLYLKRKNDGQQWEGKHPIYEEITKNTYGIIAYQEQLMQVIHKVAGLPYATADKIRKITSKKRDARELKPFQDIFVKGCLDNKTLSEDEALDFWEALQSYARYSFNRSHSIEYAIIGYWTAWCKRYFPTEFLCANLTYGSDGKKEEIIEECYRLGLKLQLPQVGISDATKWVAKDNILYVPFIEIKGVGEKTAFECTLLKGNKKEKLKGFFDLKIQEKSGSKLEKILAEVGAFGGEPLADDLSKYFSFRVAQDKRQQYPNLRKILKFDFPECDLDAILRLDVPKGFLRGMIQWYNGTDDYFKGLADCYACPLGSQCKAPVKPSPGKYNLMICGEAPGPDEDEQGVGFVGKTGEKILWPELEKYSLYREDFHVTNVCKCFPYQTKTPNKNEIAVCWQWLKQEIDTVQPRLILAFGNICQKCFTDRDGGIINLSGTTEWVEKISAWVCWSVHPSSILHNASNKTAFEAGIKNFSDKIRILGDIK
jgi:DNA polymerase-3 subunit alpha